MRFFFSLFLSLTLFTLHAHAEKEKKKEKTVTPLPEITMGSSDAPVLIIDYSSLTCNHCAEFYLKVVPKIKEKYITPGHVRFIFRDFPGDQVSLRAHQVAWCKGEMKYLDFVKLMYETQDTWLSADEPIESLKKVVAKHGISSKEFDKALKNQELMDKIIQARLEGRKKYTIKATPTLIINAKVYPEALTIEEIDEILSPILKPILEKKKKPKKEEKAKAEEKPAQKTEEAKGTTASPQKTEDKGEAASAEKTEGKKENASAEKK